MEEGYTSEKTTERITKSGTKITTKTVRICNTPTVKEIEKYLPFGRK